MCGRFTLMTDEEYQDIADILRQIDSSRRTNPPRRYLPTMFSPILFSEMGLLRCGCSVGDIRGFRGKSRLSMRGRKRRKSSLYSGKA